MRRHVAVALAVVALAACGGGDDSGGEGGGPTSASTSSPPVTDPAPAGPETMESVPPADLSTTATTAAASGAPPATGDPELDALARRCHDGAMEACDELFAVADFGSEAEEYGASCGGRLPGNVDYCVDALGD